MRLLAILIVLALFVGLAFILFRPSEIDLGDGRTADVVTGPVDALDRAQEISDEIERRSEDTFLEIESFDRAQRDEEAGDFLE